MQRVAANSRKSLENYRFNFNGLKLADDECHATVARSGRRGLLIPIQRRLGIGIEYIVALGNKPVDFLGYFCETKY